MGVTDSESVNAMVDASLGEFGRIDILVNNAGGATDGFGNSLEAITDEQWRVGIATNLMGAMYCSRAVIPHMLERGSGKIINVRSGFGLRAGRKNFIYTSAKAGLINFTRSLTMTDAPAIQANLIAPGLFPDCDPAMEEWCKHGKLVPIERVGAQEEVAANSCANEIWALDRKGFAQAIDAADERDVDSLVERAVSEFGCLDILVNAQDLHFAQPALEISLAEWRRVIDANLTGVFLACRAAGREMLKPQ